MSHRPVMDLTAHEAKSLLEAHERHAFQLQYAQLHLGIPSSLTE